MFQGRQFGGLFFLPCLKKIIQSRAKDAFVMSFRFVQKMHLIVAF